MNYTIDKNCGVPAYIQLYNMIRDDIVNGIFPFGTKIPSKRIIAAETDVSVITVEHAFSLLCEEGYLEAKERSGNFVIFREGEVGGIGLSHKKSAPVPLQPHSRGEFPFSVLAKTMRKVLLDYGERILEKSPNHGCTELREEISAYLRRSRSISVTPDRIIIGSGAEYLYGLIAQLFPKNSVFALESPSYDKIRKVYESFGMDCRMLPLENDGIPLKAITSSGANVLHTTPFNSFPSGISIGGTKKREYIQWAESSDGYIVEDNYDSELTVSMKAEDSLFSLSGGKRVIYVNTFSHTIAPSLRVGYMVLPSMLEEKFNEKLSFYSCTVPVYDQYVIAELIRSGDYERHINRIRRKKRKTMNERK